MNIRKLNNTDQLQVEALLNQHIASSLFILSNCRQTGLEYHGKAYQGNYFGAFSTEGDLRGVLAHFWNGNIMMQAPDADVLSGLVDVLKQQAARPVAGVLGDEAQAKLLIDRLGLSDADYSTNREEGLYSLSLDELIMPTASSNSRCVAVNADHEALLTRWLRAYNIEALGATEDKALASRVKQSVERMISNDDSWVLEVEGQPVALSGFNARLPEIVQVGPVWTPPEHRNRGYARLLVAGTLEIARNQGVQRSVLFTDNPAAARAYEAIGFQRIGDYRLALLRTEVAIPTH